MANFVLVGTQRSGTTMLRTALDGHPEILCLGEAFYINKDLKTARQSVGKSARGKGLGSGFASWRKLSYQSYLGRSLRRQAGHWLSRQRTIHGYLDEIYGIQGYEAIGFKIMENQLDRFPAVLGYLKDRQIKIIHVVRENPLDILLSRLSMAARGYAHSGSTPGEPVRLHVHTETLVGELVRIRENCIWWQQTLAETAPCLHVAYHRFVGARAKISREILSFLEIDSEIELESELVKLNTAPVSQMVENFADVRESLAGTEFESCLSSNETE